jgi:hypothetical protein
MNASDLASWLRDWRWRTPSASDGQGASALAPLALAVDEHWVALSATSEPEVLRLDVVLEPLPDPDLMLWVSEQLLRWSFSHPYPEAGMQFALTPDGVLLASSYLAVDPQTDDEALHELIDASVDQADETWTLVRADALLQAYRQEQLAEQVSAGGPVTQGF